MVATMLLVWAAWRGRVSWRLVGLGVLTGAAVVAGVGVIEELATGGRMSQAIFVAAAATTRVHPTDWVRGAIVLANIGGGSSCLIVLLTLAGLAHVASKRGKARAIFAVAGTIVAGSVLFLPLVHHFRPSMVTGLAMSAAPFVCLFVVIPVCAVLERRALFGSSLDGALCLFAAAEIAIVVPLCLASTGAWVNYAIQGIVFAAILTGRSLARACEAAAAAVVVVSDRPRRTRRPVLRAPGGVYQLPPCALRASLRRAGLERAQGADDRTSISSASPARTANSAGPTWSSTTGCTRFSSRCTGPSRGRPGCVPPWRTARSDSSSPLPKIRGSMALTNRLPRSGMRRRFRNRFAVRMGTIRARR